MVEGKWAPEGDALIVSLGPLIGSRSHGGSFLKSVFYKTRLASRSFT